MPPFHAGFSSFGAGGYETEFERGDAYGVDFIELTTDDDPPEDRSVAAGRSRPPAREYGLYLLPHLPHGGRVAVFGSTTERVRTASLPRLRSAVEAGWRAVSETPWYTWTRPAGCSSPRRDGSTSSARRRCAADRPDG